MVLLAFPLPPPETPRPSAVAAPDRAAEPAGFAVGSPPADAWLRGGLARGALHEVVAAAGADAPAAAGFALGLAARAGGEGPILWIRDGRAAAEAGRVDGMGLLEFGAGPARVILVQPDRSDDALWAADAGARCLGLRASGTTLILLRGGPPMPSAAMTRWRVASALSRALEANAPGHQAVSVTLVRHRAGIAERTWQMEWDRDRQRFAERAPLPGAVVPLPADGPDPARGMPADGFAARRVEGRSG